MKYKRNLEIDTNNVRNEAEAQEKTTKKEKYYDITFSVGSKPRIKKRFTSLIFKDADVVCEDSK